jgi:hypothetical protein
LHEFARDIVNGGDVISIDGVPEAKAEGQKRCAEQHREIAKTGEGKKPRRQIASQKQRIKKGNLRPQMAWRIIEDANEGPRGGKLKWSRHAQQANPHLILAIASPEHRCKQARLPDATTHARKFIPMREKSTQAKTSAPSVQRCIASRAQCETAMRHRDPTRPRPAHALRLDRRKNARANALRLEISRTSAACAP